MRLLFDHNLSHRLVYRLADLFPNSTQTSLIQLNQAPDLSIWEYARTNGFSIVTLDKDFSDLSFLRGAPPKVIWLRCGNSTVATVEALLRSNCEAVREFDKDPEACLLEIWP